MKPFFASLRAAFRAAVLAALGLCPAAPVAAAPVLPGPPTARAAGPATIASEASLEYYIGLASKLAQQDSANQLRVLENQLDALLAEKNALRAKLLAEEQEVAGLEAGGDVAKVPALKSAIQAVQTSLAQIDVDIQKILNEIQELRDAGNRTQDEAKRGAHLLDKFAAALTENPPHDPYVRTLSSSDRTAALERARKGGDALANVARVAGLTAANASSALAAAADKQRQLARDQEKRRAAQAALGAVRTPTPTPRPPTRVIKTGVR